MPAPRAAGATSSETRNTKSTLDYLGQFLNVLPASPTHAREFDVMADASLGPEVAPAGELRQHFHQALLPDMPRRRVGIALLSCSLLLAAAKWPGQIRIPTADSDEITADCAYFYVDME